MLFCCKAFEECMKLKILNLKILSSIKVSYYVSKARGLNRNYLPHVPKTIFQPVSGQPSHWVLPENLWFSCVFGGYKIGKLATEGLSLNRILTIARSQFSHFILPESTRKYLVFWCLQRVQFGKIGQKQINATPCL